jgi:two-component system response regulator AtoC
MRTRSQKVLVVDHDNTFRAFCVSAILPLGCLVVEAQDGRQGYDTFTAEGADLIISAGAMPGFNGVEMMRKIRETDQEVPVLFLNRDRSDGFEDVAGSLGNCKILREPLYSRQFRSLVEAALNGR